MREMLRKNWKNKTLRSIELDPRCSRLKEHLVYRRADSRPTPRGTHKTKNRREISARKPGERVAAPA